jgi:hypothetical protein
MSHHPVGPHGLLRVIALLYVTRGVCTFTEAMYMFCRISGTTLLALIIRITRNSMHITMVTTIRWLQMAVYHSYHLKMVLGPKHAVAGLLRSRYHSEINYLIIQTQRGANHHDDNNSLITTVTRIQEYTMFVAMMLKSGDDTAQRYSRHRIRENIRIPVAPCKTLFSNASHWERSALLLSTLRAKLCLYFHYLWVSGVSSTPRSIELPQPLHSTIEMD